MNQTDEGSVFQASHRSYSMASPSEAAWEVRLGTLEQQPTKLSLQLAGLGKETSHGDTEATTALVEEYIPDLVMFSSITGLCILTL